METSTVAVIIAGLAVLLTAIQLIFGGGWKLSGRLASMEATLRKSIEDSKGEIERRQDRATRDVGETIAGIREKIREVELFCRDTFMRRDSFYEVNKQNTDALASLGAEIKVRLERMESKIDQKT